MNFIQAAKAGNKVNKVLDDVGKQFENLTGGNKKEEEGKDGKGGNDEKEQKRWFDSQRKEAERKAEFNQRQRERNERKSNLKDKWAQGRTQELSAAPEKKGWFGLGQGRQQQQDPNNPAPERRGWFGRGAGEAQS